MEEQKVPEEVPQPEEVTTPVVKDIPEPNYKELYEELQFFSDQQRVNATNFQGLKILLDKLEILTVNVETLRVKIDQVVEKLPIPTIPGMPTVPQSLPNIPKGIVGGL